LAIKFVIQSILMSITIFCACSFLYLFSTLFHISKGYRNGHLNKLDFKRHLC